MLDRFAYTTLPARILFGPGIAAQLAGEIETLGCRRLLLVSTPGQRDKAQAIAQPLAVDSA